MTQNASLLENTLNKLTKTLEGYGYHFGDFPALADEILKNKAAKSAAELDLIQQSYEQYWEIINQQDQKIEAELDQNKKHVALFLKRFGLKVSQKFFSTLESDHIIEIYSKNHQQIFRSTNFFSLSSYNIETLTFASWEKLFHRPKELLGELFKYPETVMESNIEVMMTPNTRHILTEVATEKKFIHELVQIGCLFDEFTGHPMGYITLIKVKEFPTHIQLVH